MRFLQAPATVLGLILVALLPSVAAKPYPVDLEESRALHNGSQIVKRQCNGVPCGWQGQYCCTNGAVCFTDVNNIAACGYLTKTVANSAVPTAQATITSCRDNQSPCGGICCDSGYYCLVAGQCKQLGGSSGGIIGTVTPSAPLRPTSSTLIIVTATGTPTATVPFSTPIPTGASAVPMPQSGGGGGLSGGAIAGIVIGTLFGVFLLLLLCLFCCARALFDTILGIFGLGKKRRHTHEETYIEEHHHSSGGGGRRWYGQAAARPNRPHKSGGGFGNALGIGAALGGLALALGMKRKHDRRHDDKSTVTGSSAYYSDYTSSSSASSSDRHTRHTRHSSRR